MPLSVTVVFIAVNAAMALFLIYTVCTALPGFRRAKARPGAGLQHRFAALICARNEENVLPFLFQSLHAQNYPQNLIEVILIADNCTDDTAGVARKHGAAVIERHNLEKIGKGHALCEVFPKLGPSLSRADAVCIFDADNVVHPDFFIHMNRAYAEGACAAQGYRQMKNPADSWVSGASSLFFWMHNRFFNRARHIMGLSAQINGTGFMVSAENIRENGWNTGTITEDLELTAQTVLSGQKVVWVPDAVVFDEQPTRFKESLNQRKRWTRGIFQCLSRYSLPLLKGFFRTGKFQYLDTLISLIGVPMAALGFATGAASLGYCLFFAPHIALFSLLANYLLVVLLSLLTIRLEYGGRYRGLFLSVLFYPFALLLWVPLVAALPFQSKTAAWKPIRHVRHVSIEDIIDDLHIVNKEEARKNRVI